MRLRMPWSRDVDENNNVIVQNPRIHSPSSNLTIGFCVTLIVALLAILGTFQGVHAKDVGQFSERTLKLQTIAKKAAASGLESAEWIKRHNVNQEPEICLDEGCLDAAMDLLDAANLTVDPCKDFYEFACGKWLANNPVPPSASRWSRFNGLRDEVNRITQEILTEATNINDPKPVNQVKDFYAECINTAKLEAAGVVPIVFTTVQFGGWPMLSPADWSETDFDWIKNVAEIRRRLYDDPIISIYVDRDLKNTSRSVVYVDQPSLGLPRGVLVDAPSYPTILAAYKTYIVSLAQALGSNESPVALDTAAQAIIDFEIRLANISSPDEERYDVEIIYNPYKLNVFQRVSDEVDPTFFVDWRGLLDQVFSSSGVAIHGDEDLIVAGEDYVKKLIPVLKTTPQRVIADYLGYRVASSFSSETTQLLRDITFNFTSALTGARVPQTRASSCAGSANGNFGMAIGVKYIEAAFDKEAKALVDGLVENLRVAFKGLIAEAEWMETSTQVEAQAKADAIRSFMAYPEWLENNTAVNAYYAGLELATGTEAHFQTILNLALWYSDAALGSLRKPTTQDEWLTYPGVVNAFYSPQHNSITFPAGILQPPFFGKLRPASQNYGGIGMVIGHEVTHGFDNQGSQFDKDGNAEEWWDEVTRSRYEEKTQCVSDQYGDFYVPSVDMYVNGDLTLGENIADNGGIRESFRAYRRYVEQLGKEEGRLPGLEQLTPNQLFFLGYANVWCESITDEGLVNQLLTDPHSPAKFRVIGPLRNSNDFTEAYACPVDADGMNPPLPTKCEVW